MANEATVQVNLLIQRRSDDGALTLLDYQSRPTSFRADVAGTKGPCPGAVTANVGGTAVDLTQLTTPGLCRLMNCDATNYVEVGVWDPQTDVFYPLLELLPGESFVVRLTRNLAEEYVGTGTGTTAPTNHLLLKANTAPCVVLVEAFEK